MLTSHVPLRMELLKGLLAAWSLQWEHSSCLSSVRTQCFLQLIVPRFFFFSFSFFLLFGLVLLEGVIITFIMHLPAVYHGLS